MSRQINIGVSDLVYERVSELARTAKMPVSTYAKMLFEAAYAARWCKSGDPDLDAKVGCAVVLHGARRNTSEIARAVGLHEATIERIINVWQSQADIRPISEAAE